MKSASQIPHHIVFDRVSFHGNRSGSLVRAILGNGDHIQMINSLCYDIHFSNDSQCFMAYNGNGPFLIENNYLSAAGENILFGGADPSYFWADSIGHHSDAKLHHERMGVVAATHRASGYMFGGNRMVREEPARNARTASGTPSTGTSLKIRGHKIKTAD